MDRRTFLGAVGGTATIGLAGTGLLVGPELVLEITEVDGHAGFSGAVTQGTATNTGISEIGYAKIRAHQYDGDDTYIGTAVDEIHGLGPGEDWHFRCVYTGSWSQSVEYYETETSAQW